MPDPAPDPDSAVLLARELRVTIGRLRRLARGFTATGDLTASQTAVLTRLGKDGPATTSGLAVAEGVRPQSMGATVADLVGLGLVDRTPHPTDARARTVTLTDAGRARFAGDRAAREEWLARLVAERYTADERAALLAAVALLERLQA